jgi:uncharacterized damage-inducible protein DinB
MNVAELFVKRWEAEQPAFAKVIRAIPGHNLAYAPHERSTNAGALAWQLAEEQRGLSILLDKGEFLWTTQPAPASIDEIAAAWDKATTDLRQSLSALDEAKLSQKATLDMGGEMKWSDTLDNMLWGFLFDMVHHRGQLSAYLRPMGGKVPAIYGPSADDSGGA